MTLKEWIEDDGERVLAELEVLLEKEKVRIGHIEDLRCAVDKRRGQ